MRCVDWCSGLVEAFGRSGMGSASARPPEQWSRSTLYRSMRAAVDGLGLSGDVSYSVSGGSVRLSSARAVADEAEMRLMEVEVDIPDSGTAARFLQLFWESGDPVWTLRCTVAGKAVSIYKRMHGLASKRPWSERVDVSKSGELIRIRRKRRRH